MQSVHSDRFGETKQEQVSGRSTSGAEEERRAKAWEEQDDGKRRQQHGKWRETASYVPSLYFINFSANVQ